MKRFLVLAALVLGLASCQREPEGLDLNVGGEVATEITVSLPEDVTRAVAGTDSAKSDIEAILDKGDLKLRYILQVFDAEGESFKAMDFKYADAESVVFPVRLVPNRHYRFVVWADLVENDGLVDGQDCDDLHYVIGTSLRDIKLADDWKAMDETRDAYTGYYKTTGNGFVGTESINITLTRPFAKLRVVTTDIDELFDGVYPHNAVVTYTTNHYKAFDAFAATPGDRTLAGKQHTYVIDTYSSENPAEQMTLYTDYFFATEEDDAVRFNIDVKEADGTTIKLSSFNTDIKVKRNYLTTLIGDVLTEGSNVNVEVQPGLGGTENPDIVYNVITSGAELAQAVANGGSYKVGNNIYVAATRATTFATRAGSAGGDTTTINLNGYKITFEEDATIEVPAGKTLIINDESENNTGAIEAGNNAGFDNKGTIKIESGIVGESSIDNNGGTVNIEGGDLAEGAVQNNSGTANIVGDNIDENVVNGDVTNYYAGIVEAFANGGEYTLGASLELEQPLTLANDKTLKLTIAEGAVLSIVDSTEKNFQLIDNRGTLTVEGAGKMTVEATINSGWNRYSAVIANNPGGNLTVKGVTLEHLGGTDMAYGIDNLTNGKGTVAVTTIEGATVKSTYRAVRQFLNGVEATNELYVKAGSTLRGDNNAIFFQDPNKNANPGKLVVEEGAALYGNVYLFVTEGSTEWPVEVSVAASALKEGEVTYKNVPEGYKVVEKNGAWIVVQYAKVASADELVAALEANKDVIFTKDIKIDPATMSNAYGTTGINVKNGQTIDGDGHILDIKGAGGTWDSGINTTGGLIKNITVTGSFRGIFINHNSTHSETVVLDNVTIEGTTYTISCDQGMNQNFKAYNSTFKGWTSYAATIGTAYFENCYFGEGSGYAFCRPYAATEFVGCQFEAGYRVNPQAAVTFDECTLAGEPLTFANIAELSDNLNKVVVNGIQMVADGVYVDAEGAYNLYNKAGMTWFSDQINNKKNTFTGKTIKVVNDIDMAGATYYGGSINSYPSYSFKGTFDGGENVISNLTITVEDDIHGAAALIPTLAGDGTTVKNVTLKNVNISSSHYAGGIWGYTTSDNCYINVTNCHVEGGTITGNICNNDNADKIGGIGGIFYTGIVSNCSVKGVTISGYRDIAGIVGWASNAKATIKNNTLEDVTINVNNDTNYKNYTKRSQYDVNNYVGEGVGTAKLEGNTGEATINWGSIAE